MHTRLVLQGSSVLVLLRNRFAVVSLCIVKGQLFIVGRVLSVCIRMSWCFPHSSASDLSLLSSAPVSMLPRYLLAGCTRVWACRLITSVLDAMHNG